MTPRTHQIEGAVWALKTIRQYGLAYLGWQERTGKTLTALEAVEMSQAKTCLIVTKKRAIGGWEETLEKWIHDTVFEVINYESIHKVRKSYDFIILDESHHAISGIGRPSKTWKAVKSHTTNKPILYLSATPYAEHVGLLYHQLKLSNWTPFKQSTYFKFHEQFGIPAIIYTAYGPQPDRTKFRIDEVLDCVSHLFNWKTRTEVGIIHEPKPNEVVIKASAKTTLLMKEWKNARIININGHEILGDSDAKLRSVHYQIEGGTIKVSDVLSTRTGSTEKLDYIRSNYSGQSVAVMAHFIAERELLSERLGPNIRILSSDGHAEGVDLSGVDKLVVYSMSHKTSKYTQRLARQANHNRDTPIVVDILCMDKPGVGRAVYESVAIKKENFVKSSYERAIK